jgi:hypothetical protein
MNRGCLRHAAYDSTAPFAGFFALVDSALSGVCDPEQSEGSTLKEQQILRRFAF